MPTFKTLEECTIKNVLGIYGQEDEIIKPKKSMLKEIFGFISFLMVPWVFVMFEPEIFPVETKID